MCQILLKYQDFSFYYNIISSSRALKILLLDRISPPDLVSLYEFILMEELPRNEQTFKLNFNWSWKTVVMEVLYEESRKNPRNTLERSSCVRLESFKINKPLCSLPVYIGG